MSTPQITTYPIRVTSPESEVSKPFLQGMANRMSVSFHKYGLVTDAYPHKVDALATLEARLDRYRETGNTEWLIDAANMAMIEFMCPSVDGAEFRATDSDESIGRVTTDGETTVASNVTIGG